MEVDVAVAKIPQHTATESTDLLEVIERPQGGLSVVLADGGSGQRAVSLLVVRKVIGLLAEGVRDGAAARAASDALFTERQGKNVCNLNIASVDFLTNTLVLTRNNPAPIFFSRGAQVDCLGGGSTPVGGSRSIRPEISEIPLEPDLMVVLFSDGLLQAGKQSGQQIEICTLLQAMLEDQSPSVAQVVDTLLGHALLLEDNRPADDISVVAIKVTLARGDKVRRMNVRLPFSQTDSEQGLQ